MAASETHNEIVLRPPPGTRFTIFGSDVHIQFQRGREREIVQWLRSWIDTYIEPEALKAEAVAANGNSTNTESNSTNTVENGGKQQIPEALQRMLDQANARLSQNVQNAEIKKINAQQAVNNNVKKSIPNLRSLLDKALNLPVNMENQDHGDTKKSEG